MLEVKVPELMKEKASTPIDLMNKASIAYGTSSRLSKGDVDAISIEVLKQRFLLFAAQVEVVLEQVKEQK